MALSGEGLATRFGAFAAAALALALVLAPAASANTYKPTTTADHAPHGHCTKAKCTLRDAVIAANSRKGADTIELRGGKTYNLSVPGDDDAAAMGDLDITGPLVIDHSGRKRATVDAQGIDRVFDVPTGASPVTFKGIAITDGAAGGLSGYGGGLRVIGGKTKLADSVLSSNQTASPSGGGGVYNSGGTLVISHSTVIANGSMGDAGGIATNSVVKIVASTIRQNHASGKAGGILVGGAGSKVTILRSTVNGNTAGDVGGGIWNDVGELVMRNDTVAGNMSNASGGGIEMNQASFASPQPFTELNNVTIARNVADADDMSGGNGGGIAGDGTADAPFQVANSIVALNTVGSSGGGPNCAADQPFASEGHNLRGTNDILCDGFVQPGDIVRADPGLGTLSNNGGPTKTIPLKPSSPAIGHANATTAEKRDQRGFVRDAHPDDGAYERGAGP